MSQTVDTYTISETLPNFESGRCLPKYGYFIKQTNKLYNSNNGLIFFNEEHDEYIFKLTHPIGTVLLFNEPLFHNSEATLISNDAPTNIVYRYHNCLYKYLTNSLPYINFTTNYLSTGVAVQNGPNSYSENGISIGGNDSITVDYSGVTDPTELTDDMLPSHFHSVNIYDNTGTGALQTNRFCLSRTTFNSSTFITTKKTGGDPPDSHSHTFNVLQENIPIEPRYVTIYPYLRIE